MALAAEGFSSQGKQDPRRDLFQCRSDGRTQKSDVGRIGLVRDRFRIQEILRQDSRCLRMRETERIYIIILSLQCATHDLE